MYMHVETMYYILLYYYIFKHVITINICNLRERRFSQLHIGYSISATPCVLICLAQCLQGTALYASLIYVCHLLLNLNSISSTKVISSNFTVTVHYKVAL